MRASAPIRLSDARSAVEELLLDPERTELVFEITEALAGRQPQRLLRRVRRSSEGRHLLREQPSFDPSTCNFEALDKLPAESFGHEFARWMRENHFQPGLMDRDSKATDPEVAYLGRRLTQVHDFWHVLSGYNRDPVGELGVLAFTVGQSGARGIAFIVAMVMWRSICEHWKSERRPWSPLVAYVWRAYRAGRRADFLPPLVLEDLFPLPLASVREVLRIEPLESRFSPDALPPIAAPSPA